MAFKFEIKDTHFLIVTDTSIVDPVEAMVLDMPKADAYYDHRLLKVRADVQKSEHVYIYDKNDTSTEGAKMFNEPLAECIDDNDVAFTKDSFITWMRTNTGFNLASGSGAIPWKYTATNYTDLTTVVAPTADEGDLAVVYNSQGVWPVNRRLRGIYIYLGGSWVYANQELQDILAAKLDSVVAGSGISIDNTDPLNPIILNSILHLQNRIIVNQANVSTTLGGVIDSTKEYFIDGVVNTSGVTINVPAGGLNLKGFNFETSFLKCSDDNYTMFSSLASGEVLFLDFAIEVTGLNSKVFDLTANTGFEAIEQININYDNCVDRGELINFRQGREVGCGYFGGSPTLTLSGTMIGGYIFRDSIVRGLDDTFTGALFQEGTALSIQSRFLSDANIDLGANCSFINFQASNFVNSSSVQLVDMVITRNGVNDPTDTNVIPNLMPNDLVCSWRLNQGILNTYIGGNQFITTETTTNISASGTFYTLAGTWTTTDLQHFDPPANGQMRNIGESPNEFKIITYIVLDGGQNDLITIRVRKYDSSTGLFSTVVSQNANINAFQGGNDRCTFSILGKTVLNMNDYVFLEVANNTDTTDVEALIGSFLTVEER